MSQDDLQYPSGFGLQDVISYGSTGLVVLDAASNTAIKKPLDQAYTRYVDVERQIYERFIEKGGHDGILSYYGVFEDGIRLEYAANYDLKSFDDSGQLPEQRLRWFVQIAEALKFIHSSGVVHGDLSSANVFLDADLNAKVADFAGSSLDQSPLLIESSACYQCPEAPLSVKGDLFAFGSLVYEIITGREPYQGLDGDEIRHLYSRKTFPDTKPLGGLGSIIEKCWHGEYSGCDDMLQELKGNDYTCPISLCC
ncbi:hypothetical protein CP533_2259 [Ophiocordyceps camponoti-saundersi (nom. inval.)]|nr:hypothetical protein CP533_2259 [Ophiocordyceps camponoti-saundersi (nom. inval.)]